MVTTIGPSRISLAGKMFGGCWSEIRFSDHMSFQVLDQQCESIKGNMVWYGIVEFNVPLDTV